MDLPEYLHDLCGFERGDLIESGYEEDVRTATGFGGSSKSREDGAMEGQERRARA